MSMDDIYESAQRLEHALVAFNDQVRGSIDAVNRAHTNVAPLWVDTMRRDYDSSWLPLEESMNDYIQRTGPQYVDVLIERLKALRAYLHGS
jgi:hypothetical protein